MYITFPIIVCDCTLLYMMCLVFPSILPDFSLEKNPGISSGSCLEKSGDIYCFFPQQTTLKLLSTLFLWTFFCWNMHVPTAPCPALPCPAWPGLPLHHCQLLQTLSPIQPCLPPATKFFHQYCLGHIAFFSWLTGFFHHSELEIL